MADPTPNTSASMATPQVKRRRLNTAKNTLNKPFKSPFRKPLKTSTTGESRESTGDTTTPQIESCMAATKATLENGASKPNYLAHLTPSRSVSTPLRSHKSSTITATPVSRSKKLATATPKPSPSITREIINLRADIQILEQALSLSTSTKDEDLAVLVDRWRTASRAAAEEVFAGTRDRVNRMGGVGAWKEREKEQKEWRTKWDREEAEAEAERRRELKEEGDAEGEDERYEEYGDTVGEAQQNQEEKEEVGGNGDDSFTMDMMLKTLNIDLKLIGYDKEGQRWEG